MKTRAQKKVEAFGGQYLTMPAPFESLRNRTCSTDLFEQPVAHVDSSNAAQISATDMKHSKKQIKTLVENIKKKCEGIPVNQHSNSQSTNFIEIIKPDTAIANQAAFKDFSRKHSTCSGSTRAETLTPVDCLDYPMISLDSEYLTVLQPSSLQDDINLTSCGPVQGNSDYQEDELCISSDDDDGYLEPVPHKHVMDELKSKIVVSNSVSHNLPRIVTESRGPLGSFNDGYVKPDHHIDGQFTVCEDKDKPNSPPAQHIDNQFYYMSSTVCE